MTKAAVVALLLTVLGSPVSAAPLIANGSFESLGFAAPSGFNILPVGSSTVSGWSIGGAAGVDYFKVATVVSDGLYSIDLVRGPGQGGIISTTATGLLAGALYEVTFDILQGLIAPGTTIIASAGSASGAFLNATAGVYHTYALDFVATGPTASISFAGPASGGIDSGVFVDNVRIAAVPEAGTVTVLGLGLIGLVASRRRNMSRAAS